MAIINGTDFPEIIAGTNADDQIFAEGGSDTLLGSLGNDLLNGGGASSDAVGEVDTADYRQLQTAITLLPTGVVNKGSLGQDQLQSIETIIAPVNRNNIIDASSSTGTASIQVDLGANQLTVRDIPGLDNLNFTVQNFRSVIGTNNADEIIGNSSNNTITGLGGNDVINGSAGSDTADYRQAQAPITLLPQGVVTGQDSGTDQLRQIEKIIAPLNQSNQIDASTAGGNSSIFANLATNTLQVDNAIPSGSLNFAVQNFVNVTGTDRSDSISGNAKANRLVGLAGDDKLAGQDGRDNLTGGDGNDFLAGGGQDDVLVGTDSLARGRFEVDTLQGNLGFDRFVLGDKLGSYYVNDLIIVDPFPGPVTTNQVTGDTSTASESSESGVIRPIFFNSYALIEDFSGGDSIQLGIGDTYQVVQDAQGFDIFSTSFGKDLVADVRTQLSLSLPKGDIALSSGESLDFLQGA